MAVYSKKDYENFINRDKIRKKKIKKRIYTILSIVLVIATIASSIILFRQDKTNFMKDDNYTEAINYAIQQFVNIEVVSHNDYPRLTYDFFSLPPIPPEDLVVKDDNTINKDYTSDNNEEDPDSETENNNNQETTDNNQTEIKDDNIKDNNNKDDNNKGNDKDNNIEGEEEPDYIVDKEEEEPPYYEYDYFREIAGKGNYPGCGVAGPNFIRDIRAELGLAIKAYTRMPLITNTKEKDYRLDYKDDTYDYVYFFLAGVVKKVDKSYLKNLDETATNKNVFNIYNFWISLTEDKSSQLAKVLLNKSNEGIYSVVVSDATGKPLSNAKISFISGSYIESYTVTRDSVVIFDNVPFGMAELRVEKDGYINFPHEVAYKNYEQINIVNDKEYYGQNVTNPMRVKLLASSAAKCTFSYTTLHYEYGVGGYKTTLEKIDGNFNVTLRNKETKEEITKVISYDDDYFYWFEFFDNVKVGEYEIDIYPTDINYRPLYLKKVYINEHGISIDGYLDEDKDYTFAFNKDEKVNVALEIKDSTSYGLNSPNDQLSIYQLIQTNAISKDGWVELKLVDNKGKVTTEKLNQNKDGLFVGNTDVLQDMEYDIYVSTVYGDILLQENLNLRTNNYAFSANITDDILPKCIANISIQRNESCIAEIVNTINGSEKYILEKQSENGKYSFNTKTPISSGLYFLNIYDTNNNLIETYLVLISSKSNNYTLKFN